MLPGTLLPLIHSASARALERGALRPVPTQGTTLVDDGVEFAVRVLDNVARKQATAVDPTAPPQNPFLPYDPDLYVADVCDTHVALLNKFNVVPHHLLIVTRQFEPQESWLTGDDLAVWLTCLEQYPSLGFYNSGAVAGASQPHKHLQLVPLPLGPVGPPFPLQPRWQAAQPCDSDIFRAHLPFPHGLVRLAGNSDSNMSQRVQHLERAYRRLLAALGIAAAQGTAPQPHNLLLTRQWLFAVPRGAETFESISLNAMAFAGGFFVRNQRQLERLREAGPLAALRAVARP